ncbi:hypothetical protein IFR05_014398 [Cadophora sp. M221]|nr:hypothetical protein IFR05_014398 [Cadophora sp. M221]
MPPSADPPVKQTGPRIIWLPKQKRDLEEATRKEGEKEECHFNRTEHACGHRSAHPTLPRITHASPCTCLGVGSTLRPSKASTTKLFHVNYDCLDCDEGVQNTGLKEKMATISVPADDTMKSSVHLGTTVPPWNEYDTKKDEATRVVLATKSDKIKPNDEDTQIFDEEPKMKADRQARRLKVKEMIEEGKRAIALKKERQLEREVAAAANKELAESQKPCYRPGFPVSDEVQKTCDKFAFEFETDSGVGASGVPEQVFLEMSSKPATASMDEARSESKNSFGRVHETEASHDVTMTPSPALFPRGLNAKDREAFVTNKWFSGQSTSRTPPSRTLEESYIPANFWYHPSFKTEIPKAATDLSEWQFILNKATLAANEHGNASEFIGYYMNKFLMESLANRAAMHTGKAEAGKSQARRTWSYGTGVPGKVVAGKAVLARLAPGRVAPGSSKSRSGTKNVVNMPGRQPTLTYQGGPSHFVRPLMIGSDDSASAGSTKNSLSAIAPGQLLHGGLPSAASTSANLGNETQAKELDDCTAMGQSTIFFANEKSHETTKAQHQNEKFQVFSELAPGESSHRYSDSHITRCLGNPLSQSTQVKPENKQHDTYLSETEKYIRHMKSGLASRGTPQTNLSGTAGKTGFSGPICRGYTGSSARAPALLHENFMTSLMTNSIRNHDILAASVRTPGQSIASAVFKEPRVTEKDLYFNLLADRHPVKAPWVCGVKASADTKNGNAAAVDNPIKATADDGDKEKCIRDTANIAKLVATSMDTVRRHRNALAKKMAVESVAENTKPALAPAPETKKQEVVSESKRPDPKRLVAREVEDEWVDLAPNNAAAQELARQNTSTGVVKKPETRVQGEGAKSADGEWEDLGGDEESWDFC